MTPVPPIQRHDETVWAIVREHGGVMSLGELMRETGMKRLYLQQIMSRGCKKGKVAKIFTPRRLEWKARD